MPDDLFPPTLEDAIAELKRELAMREHVYPRLVAQRKLKADEVGRRNGRLMKAIEILEGVHREQS